MLLPGILVEWRNRNQPPALRSRRRRDNPSDAGPRSLYPPAARDALGQSQMRSRIFIQSLAGDRTASDLRTLEIEVAEDLAPVLSVRGKAHFQPATGGALVRLDPGYFAEWPSALKESQAVA